MTHRNSRRRRRRRAQLLFHRQDRRTNRHQLGLEYRRRCARREQVRELRHLAKLRLHRPIHRRPRLDRRARRPRRSVRPLLRQRIRPERRRSRCRRLQQGRRRQEPDRSRHHRRKAETHPRRSRGHRLRCRPTGPQRLQRAWLVGVNLPRSRLPELWRSGFGSDSAQSVEWRSILRDDSGCFVDWRSCFLCECCNGVKGAGRYAR